MQIYVLYVHTIPLRHIDWAKAKPVRECRNLWDSDFVSMNAVVSMFLEIPPGPRTAENQPAQAKYLETRSP